MMSLEPCALIPDRLWDGIADEAEMDRAVIVEADKIKAVIPCGQIPGEMERFRLKGSTLLPGLIDAHVHYSEVMGPAYLAAGVTTVRDTGNDLDWILDQRERNAKDPQLGPAIVCCGFALDGPRSLWHHIIRRHTDVEAMRQSVREHVERGVDAIKLYAFLDKEMFRAGVEESHRHGKFVLTHLKYVGLEDALAIGVDETEHLERCDMAWNPSTEDEIDSIIERLLQTNHVLNPTFVVWDRFGRILDRSFYHDERRRWLHPEYLELWDHFPYRNVQPDQRFYYQAAMPHLKRFLRYAHKRGVPIALGTDAPFIHLVPGFSVHDELMMYIDCGIKPLDALRSATSTNARVLGIESRVGRIEAGFEANMVAIRGNPLERMDDISKVVLTIHKGLMLKPEDLLKKTQAMFDRELDDPITLDLRIYTKRGEVID